jgi:hypothetical protein
MATLLPPMFDISSGQCIALFVFDVRCIIQLVPGLMDWYVAM